MANWNNDLSLIEEYQPETVDILMVVRNQLSYTKACVDALYQITNNFKLFIWDNNSTDGTRDYLESLSNENLFIHWNETNNYFIRPNNELIKLGNSPYVILLNNDVLLKENWEKVLIAKLQSDASIGSVGYLGGLVNDKGKGIACWYGQEVDYIQGWCLAFRRSIYDQIGLFSDDFKYAYCEDADFGFRLRTAGYSLYASYLKLVTHISHITSNSENSDLLKRTFQENHAILAKKWAIFLSEHRCLLSHSEIKAVAKVNQLNESLLLAEAGF